VEFEWDEHNLRHVFEESPHGLTPAIVRAISRRRPKLFPNEPGQGRSGSHVMIGPDERNRFWTVVLLELDDDRWRPITGWRTSNSERELYEDAEDENEQ
jgi:uncharacterized DUF497 family protein